MRWKMGRRLLSTYHQYEQLIFPADEYGVQDTLIYNGEEGMYKDPDGLEYRTVKKSRNYEWRNGALVIPIVPFVYE